MGIELLFSNLGFSRIPPKILGIFRRLERGRSGRKKKRFGVADYSKSKLRLTGYLIEIAIWLSDCCL